MVATILTNAAESNRGVLRYIPEVTWGTTPGSGVVKTMRITDSSIQAKKTTKTSSEIRADRMVSDVIETAAMTDGSVKWEMSAGGQDDFYAQFLLSAWSRSMNYLLVRGSSVSVVTTSKIRLAGKDWSLWLANNQFIKLEGFTDPANNGYFQVSSFSFTGGNTDIITVETSLVIEAGSSYTKLMDANDVIFKATTASLASGNKIVKTGAFASTNIQIGNKLFLEGLGKERGAIQVAAALPVNNQKFSITDGVNSVTFEFATSLALASSGNVFVQISTDPSVTADNIKAAVMDQFRKQRFRVSAAKVAGTKESGTIAFSGTASAGDKVTVDDGRNTPVQFTYVASGAVLGSKNVNIGASATASAHNLKLEIDAQVTAGALNVTATDATGTATITNNNYLGGTLTEDVDGGSVITVVNFSGGAKPSISLVNHLCGSGAITESLAALTTTAFSGGDVAKQGFVTVVALVDNDTIQVAETLTVDANSTPYTVVLKGSHVRNPGDVASITKQSMSAETGFTDVGKYLGHNGLRVDSFSMSLAPGNIVTGDFAFMGRQTLALDATVLGNTGSFSVLEATTEEVFNATSNVGDVLRNGAPLTTAILKIDVKGSATLRNQQAVGAKFPAGIGYGRFTLTGSFDAYFQNFDLYRDFLNHTTASLAWTMEDPDHMKYYFTVPSVKYDSDPIALTGIDKDVTETIAWTAFRDVSLGTMFMVDRFSSVWPASVA